MTTLFLFNDVNVNNDPQNDKRESIEICLIHFTRPSQLRQLIPYIKIIISPVCALVFSVCQHLPFRSADIQVEM